MGNKKSIQNEDISPRFQIINYLELDIKESNKIFILIDNDLEIGKIITDYYTNITVKINEKNLCFNFCQYTDSAKCIYIKLTSPDYYGTLTIKKLNDDFLVKITYYSNTKFPFYITDSGIINCNLKQIFVRV